MPGTTHLGQDLRLGTYNKQKNFIIFFLFCIFATCSTTNLLHKQIIHLLELFLSSVLCTIVLNAEYDLCSDRYLLNTVHVHPGTPILRHAGGDGGVDGVCFPHSSRWCQVKLRHVNSTKDRSSQRGKGQVEHIKSKMFLLKIFLC